MHEYSIMVDIVNAALKSIENYDVESVQKIFLDVGELTFLNPEQLKFCFTVLIKDNILKGAELEIQQKRAEIECKSCEYKGPLEKQPEEDHFRIPRISCPKCEGEIKLLSGRECILRNIKMTLRDENPKEQKEQVSNTS
ncbi:MAG: hydrogenase maturation nickel metallochaperone HypA [Thermoplasmata archaeon]|nr:MAG: hydrogenase maturation nickel metallochaperone HypA [Thermoplasmata archaeon]